MGFLAAAAPIISTVGAVVGTGMQVAGAVKNRKQAIKQEQYNAQVARNNKKLADQDAALAEVNAREEMVANQAEAVDWGTSASEQIGQILAQQSASGTLMLGSNQAVVEGARQLTQRDQQRIRREGYRGYRERLREARDIRRQGDNYQAEVGAANTRRRAASTSGMLNIGSSLIGGAQAIMQVRRG